MTDRGVKVSYSAVSNYGDHLVLWLTQQKKKKSNLIIPDLSLLPLKRVRTTLREWPSYTSSVSNYYFFSLDVPTVNFASKSETYKETAAPKIHS